MKSDVCLILEGTYPYVAGGVSTWIAQLLQYMPQLTFSILYIGAKSDHSLKPKYPIPSNVTEIKEVYLHSYSTSHSGHKETLRDKDFWSSVKAFEEAILAGLPLDTLAITRAVQEIHSDRQLVHLLAQSKQCWNILTQLYREKAPPSASFLDFFWTNRYINIPTLRLLRTQIPEARLYHSACTGYAGLLGAQAHNLFKVPFILSEHGIYTRERRIEIFNADWILESGAETYMDLARLESFFKNWWTSFFQSLSLTAYRAAERITTLFEANREAQEHEGAPPERIHIIPNGIETKRFTSIAPRRRRKSDPLQIGFVGRVTAIKDIKTLLRSLAILKAKDIPFTLHMIGPLDEEPDYVEECREMIETLQLSQEIIFTGRVDVTEYYGKLDVLILTSISEGQPFVILEAQCAGIPVIATNVGACPELLNGRTPEDRSLGQSGIITSVASPEETAEALIFMARNPEAAAEMGDNGRQRAIMYYDIRNVMHQYLELYENHLYARSRTL